MNWDKIKIVKSNGEEIDAQAPIIISASRSTDIPAFYSDWLVQRLREGYVKWKNPFNGVFLYVSFSKVRIIIFWSKNPKPLIKHLDFIDENFETDSSSATKLLKVLRHREKKSCEQKRFGKLYKSYVKNYSKGGLFDA